MPHPLNLSPREWFLLTERYSDIILLSTIAHLKWGRNATYSKVISDLEAALLRLQHINPTHTVLVTDRLIADLNTMVQTLLPTMPDAFKPATLDFHGVSRRLARHLVKLAEKMDNQTFVQRIRAQILYLEWGLHLDTCLLGLRRDLLEQRIQRGYEPSSIDTSQCCGEEKLREKLSEISPILVEANFRKKQYFQSSDSDEYGRDVPCPDVNLFYEKFYPLFVKSTVLSMRDGVNETSNKLRDGLDSISAQVIGMVTYNDVSKLHRPFNDLIRLEMQFEDVLQTIDINQYKPIFDKWETVKVIPKEDIKVKQCIKCVFFINYTKNLTKEIDDQSAFSLIMYDFLSDYEEGSDE